MTDDLKFVYNVMLKENNMFVLNEVVKHKEEIRLYFVHKSASTVYPFERVIIRLTPNV